MGCLISCLIDFFFFPRCAHLSKSCILQLTKPIQKMASYLVCTWMLQQFLCVAIEAFGLNRSELMYWVRERGPKHRTHKQVLKRKVNCWVFGSTKVQHDLTKRMHAHMEDIHGGHTWGRTWGRWKKLSQDRQTQRLERCKQTTSALFDFDSPSLFPCIFKRRYNILSHVVKWIKSSHKCKKYH